MRSNIDLTASPSGHMRLGAIDGLRAVAVLAVVAHHMSMDAAHPFQFGARGVDLFFVISGFCLSLPTLRRLQSGTSFAFDLRQFAVDRLWRIAPPYWAALALFAALSLTAFGLPGVRGAASPLELPQDASILLTGLGPAYNPSFWTLGIEARWYLVFPALLLVYVRSKIAFALVAVLVYIWYKSPYGIADLGTLPCFMLGIVAADLSIRGHARHLLWLPATAAVLLLACFSDQSLDHGSPLWHAAAFLIVLSGVGAGNRLLSWRPLAFIGVASYSIYLVHGPTMTFLVHGGIQPFVAAIISVLAGILFWLCVERTALAARGRLKNVAVAGPQATSATTVELHAPA